MIFVSAGRSAPAEEGHYRGGPGRAGDAGVVFGPGHIDNPSSPVLFIVEARALRLNYADSTAIDLPTQCRVHALDAHSGQTRWTFESPGAIYRDVTLAAMPDQSGRFIFFSWDQHYYAADARTGALAWRVKDEGPAGSPAVIVNGGIIHTGAAALLLETGREIWRRGEARNFVLPSAAHGAFIYGGGRAARALTGDDVWSAPQPAEAITAALLAGTALIVGGYDGVLYAFDAESGQQRWTQVIGQHIYQPSADDRRVFVAARDRNLRALDIETGELVWNVTTVGGFDGTAVTAEGRVLCRTREQFLFALDAATGEELWKAPLDDEGPLPVDPAAGRGLVFVVTHQRVRAFDAATGQLRWSRTFDLAVDWAHPILAN